jgi:hypothetical protein
MGRVEKMGLKKKQGFLWEDVLMSRKWGGGGVERERQAGHGKNVANYSCENKSAIIYD